MDVAIYTLSRTKYNSHNMLGSYLNCSDLLICLIKALPCCFRPRRLVVLRSLRNITAGEELFSTYFTVVKWLHEYVLWAVDQRIGFAEFFQLHKWEVYLISGVIYFRRSVIEIIMGVGVCPGVKLSTKLYFLTEKGAIVAVLYSEHFHWSIFSSSYKTILLFSKTNTKG